MRHASPVAVLPANVVVSPNGTNSIHNTDYGNIQGRFGFAYAVATTTSLRGGYSRFYDSWNGIAQFGQNVGGNWPSVGLLTQSALNNNIPTASFNDPLGLGANPIVQPPANPFNNNGSYYDPNLKTPYTDQWNLGIDQDLGHSTTFSISYAGSHSGRLDVGGRKNTARYPGPGNAATVAARRPYPYIAAISYDQSNGNSNYHSLQTKLSRSTSNGLTYLVSYTRSKSIDIACSGDFGAEGCEIQDAYNPRADRSVSGFDVTNIFSASVVYELPLGRGKLFSPSNPIVSAIVGSWQTNAIGTFVSGAPYDVTVNGDIANTGNTFVRANLVGNPNPQKRTAAQWINTSAFATPLPYTFGNLGRNSLRSDSSKDLDLSLFRRFPLTHETGFEFRAEAFNLTNTAVFSAPAHVINSTNFGVVTSTANNPRQIQLALKLQF